MKLGEAIKRLEAVKLNTSVFYSYLGITPRTNLTSILRQISTLLDEESDLESRISKTEGEIVLEENSISSLRRALASLDKKIEVLDKVVQRTDVVNEEKSKLIEDIISFTESRDTLSQVLEKCLWEVELL